MVSSPTSLQTLFLARQLSVFGDGLQGPAGINRKAARRRPFCASRTRATLERRLPVGRMEFVAASLFRDVSGRGERKMIGRDLHAVSRRHVEQALARRD